MTTKRTIEYEIKNGALYENEIMINKIEEIILFYKTNGYSLEKANETRGEIAKLNLLSYYMSDGRKITKPIKRIVEKFLDKEIVKEKWPEICKKIAELYSIAKTVKVYFGDKSLLGSGKYEEHRTCFAEEGCNKFSRIFLEKFKRTEVLIIEDKLTGIKARCILYYAGGRNLYLINFYYQHGMINNPLLFIEAIKRLLSLKQVIFKDKIEEFEGLPIYFNGYGIHIYDKKSFDYKRNRKFPCPHCDNVVAEKHFFVDRAASTVLLGCDEDCANVRRYNCEECRGALNEEEMLEVNDVTYCQSCYEDLFITCNECDEVILNSSAIADKDGNHVYCSSCYEDLFLTCNECDEVILNSSAIADKDGNHVYCQSCYENLFITCNECDNECDKDDAIADKDGNQYCQSCYENLFITCNECNEVISKEDANHKKDIIGDDRLVCAYCNKYGEVSYV